MHCKNCGKELTGTPDFCPNCGARPLAGTNFCQNCGAPITPATEICMKCGARVGGMKPVEKSGEISSKSRLATTLLAFFLGQLGIHRFYIGKIGTAVVMLVLTIIGWATVWLVVGWAFLAATGIWAFVDFIIAVVGSMKDKDGKPITNW